MVAIIDYDAGNIKSVEKAFKYLGADTVVTRDATDIIRADRVVLPGVGAFGDAMRKLNEYGLADVIKEVTNKQTPFLGICLGLQLLFDSSDESKDAEGLGILRGKIVKFPNIDSEGNYYKVPQIGWNNLNFPREGRLFKGLGLDAFVYFVHSYYLDAADKSIVTATSDYSVRIDASVESGNVFACQFHPEKSADVGMQILTNFMQV
ncbi:imidazole glycerol phosphate synthase subunit HisH [Butyrivibrio hungatei]|uniref:Imidazole glycerol phosphate synthase subunit HisH n=1 Tax=Butyrivibrio hungatei TaxID=185008 RepID=A0A1D9P1X4_9FIRM|nr:imidazole glycerol phosphate synthase subunit HisH [Butyrivibrio hungatei]AOZ96195.1 imidazole glycerol phosphate synthase glutamine amidotransferase subunit HisH [Butyrivibrio hungatei]